MRRDEALRGLKQLFLAATCEADSAAAAVASVLFDNAEAAMEARQGLTREALKAEASRLRKGWGKEELDYNDVERELSRLHDRLETFVASQDLSLFHVTTIVGPTQRQRGDDVDLLYLRVEYSPPPDRIPGSFATAIVDALAPTEREKLDSQLAVGEARILGVDVVRNPSGRGLLVIIAVGLMTVATLLYPATRRWIARQAKAFSEPALPKTSPKTHVSGSSITVTHPQIPAWALNPFPNPGRALAGVRAGTLLYVASGSEGVRIFDVTDPETPRLERTIKTANACALAVAEPYVYVADGGGGTKVIDLRSSADHEIVATLPDPVALGIALQGSHLYIAGGASGIRVYGVASPERPTLLGNITQIGNGAARSIAVSGANAYVARERVLGVGAGVTILDISDPRDVRVKAILSFMEDCHQVLPLTRDVVLEADDGGVGAFRVTDAQPFTGLTRKLTQPVRALIPVTHGVVAVIAGDEVAFVDVQDPSRLRAVPEPPIDPAILAKGGLVYLPRIHSSKDDSVHR